MTHQTVKQLLSKWPNRKAVFEDAAKANPDLQMIAVHRWFKRNSIPVGYWSALLDGAKDRKINIKEGELAKAHSIENEATKEQPHG